MAQLGNTVINGSLRVVGDLYASGYIDTTITLTSSGWSGTSLFTQTVTVAGVKADENYRVYKYIASNATASDIKTYNKNFGIITAGYATSADNKITFTTLKKPTANITLRIVGDSNIEWTTVQNTEVTSMKSDIATINNSINTINTSISSNSSKISKLNTSIDTKANSTDVVNVIPGMAIDSGSNVITATVEYNSVYLLINSHWNTGSIYLIYVGNESYGVKAVKLAGDSTSIPTVSLNGFTLTISMNNAARAKIYNIHNSCL